MGRVTTSRVAPHVAEEDIRSSLDAIDEAFFQQRWGAPYTALDPFYTPNLELMQPWSPRL